MGGFHLFKRSLKETGKDDRGIPQEEDIPLHPLQAHDLVDCDGYESFIMPTEADIRDRGKINIFTKSVLLFQTSWFIMQCFTRAREHLPVTHLEIITVAYVAMNFVTYNFWWNKPLNVNQPVRVFRKSDPSVIDPEPPVIDQPEWKLTLEAIGEGLKTLLRLIVAGEDAHVDPSREDRVPMFWADDQDDNSIHANFIALGVAVCFGAIHCIAWRFSFPTHTELLMWRISSVAMTALPVCILLMTLLGYWLLNTHFGNSHSIIIYFGTLSGVILYIIARVVTLVLAFTSLRELPSGAYETSHWTTTIPHV